MWYFRYHWFNGEKSRWIKATSPQYILQRVLKHMDINGISRNFTFAWKFKKENK